MTNMYSFFKTLTTGDVITSSGCCRRKKDEEVLSLGQTLNKYARVELIEDSAKEDEKAIAVVLGGVDPSISDVYVRIASAESKSKPALRKANKDERKVFISKYVGNRIALSEHRINEAKEVMRKDRKAIKDLEKLAADENVKIDK